MEQLLLEPTQDLSMRFNRIAVNTISEKNNNTQTVRYIAFTDWGNPENTQVVICAHGLTRNGRDFDYLAKALQDQFRVICIDIVGRGQSDWLTNAEEYNQPAIYLSDIKILLTHILAQYKQPIHLNWVGISMGGLIGMILAGQDLPIPIKSIIMSDIGPRIPIDAILRFKRYVGEDPKFTDIDQLENYIRVISAPFGELTKDQWRHLTLYSACKYSEGVYGFRYDPRIAINFHESFEHDIDLWPFWDQLTIPALVLHGEKSDVLLPQIAEEMRIRGPRAKIIKISNVGHAPLLVNEEQISHVKGFLLKQIQLHKNTK